MALLEAMAAGLPIGASAVAGTRQVVTSGLTGVLVPPGDVDALADALARLALSPPTRLALGSAGRSHAVAEFSVGRQAKRHAELYRALIGAPHIASPAEET